MRWDPPPRIIRPKEMNVRPRSNMGYVSGQDPMEGIAYCSRQLSPSPTWGSRFVGARELGPREGEPKLLRKTPFGGNPSLAMTYLPTC